METPGLQTLSLPGSVARRTPLRRWMAIVSLAAAIHAAAFVLSLRVNNDALSLATQHKQLEVVVTEQQTIRSTEAVVKSRAPVEEQVSLKPANSPALMRETAVVLAPNTTHVAESAAARAQLSQKADSVKQDSQRLAVARLGDRSVSAAASGKLDVPLDLGTDISAAGRGGKAFDQIFSQMAPAAAPTLNLGGKPAFPRACRQGLCRGKPCEGSSRWRIQVPAQSTKPLKIECLAPMDCELQNAAIRKFFSEASFPAAPQEKLYVIPVSMYVRDE